MSCCMENIVKKPADLDLPCFQLSLGLKFVSPYPTDPEKKVLLKKFYFNFQSRIIFFYFIANLDNFLMQTVLSLKKFLEKLFVYLIVLPLVGLYSKTLRLNEGQKYCRMLPGSILQYF